MCKTGDNRTGNNDAGKFVQLDPDTQGELIMKMQGVIIDMVRVSDEHLDNKEPEKAIEILGLIQGNVSLLCSVIENKVTLDDLDLIDCL
jgi:hypothetical protein